MSRVTLVFNEGDDQVQVDCERSTMYAAEVEVGDYIECPHSGFVHVHKKRIDGRVVFLHDCRDHGHIYYVYNKLEIARPDSGQVGGC